MIRKSRTTQKVKREARKIIKKKKSDKVAKVSEVSGSQQNILQTGGLNGDPQSENEQLNKKFATQGEIIKDEIEDEDLGPIGIPEENPRDIRDYLWNYPGYLLKIFKALRPFSAILLFSLISFWLFNVLTSPDFISSFKAVRSGTFVEGTIGENVNTNPLFLAQNQADRDIRELVFQKFISIDKDANPVPEIAYEWGSDVVKTDTDAGTVEEITYTFKIKQNIYFSDGEKLDADDVIFTFDTAMKLARDYNKDTVGKALDGVTIEKVDDYTVKFTLSEKSATFYESVAIYIIPKHYYEIVSIKNLDISNLNETAIGSGPYKIVSYKYNVIKLESSEFYDPVPKINEIEYRLYPDYESLKVAYENNMLDAVSNVGGESHNMGGNYTHFSLTLFTRKKLIFLNNRLELFSDSALRKGLNYIVDKERLLDEIGIAGKPANGPIYEDSWAYNENVDYPVYDLDRADKEFTDAGFTKNAGTGFYQSEDGKILSMSISYLDNELNEAIVNELVVQFEEAGVLLNPVPQTYNQITRETIATRNFELLLYEVQTTVDPDQYNLWHSLKADFPNLNLAGFNFVKTDVELEKARKTTDRDEREKEYDLFQKFFVSESPVVFLYYAHFDYFLSDDVVVPDFDGIIYPEDRFNNISEWEIR